MKLTIIERISFARLESQIPFIPKNTGRIKTATQGKTRALKKDIMNETAPLFRSVKKAEENIPNPIKRKVVEKSLKPETVIFTSFSS